MALANLAASFFINFLTLVAEVAGVAIALQLATDVNYLLWIPPVTVVVWLVVWRVKFSAMEQAFGLCGLLLVAFAVALWRFGPDWGGLWSQATTFTPPQAEGWAVYFYYGVALFGAAMTPYEVFFFSSGGVEEGWSRADLIEARANVAVGFPLGGVLSLAIAGLAGVVYLPLGVQVDTLGQVALPVATQLGAIGLAVLLVGIFAATFGAALETVLSCGYSVAQYFGWQWGKFVRPAEASRFHALMIVAMLAGSMALLTTVDPIKVTEYSVVFSAVALPLTYLPILMVANDPDYLGEKTNGPIMNALSTIILGVVLLASLAAIPLMIYTKAGQ
jgi:Mn2+/Fe2+ NRAMP family transporter